MAATPEIDQTSESEIELIGKVWEKAVDTQMHFNEMCVKSRQLGLTFVAAALGLALFLFTRGGPDAHYAVPIVVCGYSIEIHAAVLITLAAAAAVYAVKILDLRVYHRMLRGAVAFGEELEERRLRPLLGVEKGMTQAISHFSRKSDARMTIEAGRAQYSGAKEETAEKKLTLFYRVVIAFLFFSAAALLLIGNLSIPSAP
jgi:hypothetical protein